MKSKTSLPFWQNPFCRSSTFACLTFFLFWSFGQAFAQNQQTPNFSPKAPGLIESLERLVLFQKGKFEKNKTHLQSNFKNVADLKSFKEVKLDPTYMKSLLLHSDERFFSLVAQGDECKFLSLLETNLLKTSEGNIEDIHIQYQTTDGKIESAIMSKDLFFTEIYKKKCLNNREYATLFSNENIQKTIEGIKFSIPKTQKECLIIHQEWIANSFTPYLCRITETFNRPTLQTIATFYREKIAAHQRIYLLELCKTLHSPELFCANYLKGDAWSKIINLEIPEYKMSYKCQNMFGKSEKLNSKELKNCASKLQSDDHFCFSNGNKDLPSNYPLQSCNLISTALNKSKLVTDYHDCPGNIPNDSLTNIHRIVNHFTPRKIENNKETCGGETQYTYARLHLDIKHESGWPLKVCFFDRVNNKESCTTYIPGSRADEPLSEDQVIAKILYRQKGANPKTTCKIVGHKTYNPLRSEFKYGCFIIYGHDFCSESSCGKKVIWDEKIQEDIKFVGTLNFDYFPTAFMNERYSFTALLNETRSTKERKILNLTELKFFLDKTDNGIVHGIGCREDLVPELYNRISLNECHPLPFIVDGHHSEENKTLLITRLAIDDIHSPRLIPWSYIFNAVTSYQQLHPLQTWTFYGIYK